MFLAISRSFFNTPTPTTLRGAAFQFNRVTARACAVLVPPSKEGAPAQLSTPQPNSLTEIYKAQPPVDHALGLFRDWVSSAKSLSEIRKEIPNIGIYIEQLGFFRSLDLIIKRLEEIRSNPENETPFLTAGVQSTKVADPRLVISKLIKDPLILYYRYYTLHPDKKNRLRFSPLIEREFLEEWDRVQTADRKGAIQAHDRILGMITDIVDSQMWNISRNVTPQVEQLRRRLNMFHHLGGIASQLDYFKQLYIEGLLLGLYEHEHGPISSEIHRDEYFDFLKSTYSREFKALDKAEIFKIGAGFWYDMDRSDVGMEHYNVNVFNNGLKADLYKGLRVLRGMLPTVIISSQEGAQKQNIALKSLLDQVLGAFKNSQELPSKDVLTKIKTLSRDIYMDDPKRMSAMWTLVRSGVIFGGEPCPRVSETDLLNLAGLVYQTLTSSPLKAQDSLETIVNGIKSGSGFTSDWSSQAVLDINQLVKNAYDVSHRMGTITELLFVIIPARNEVVPDAHWSLVISDGYEDIGSEVYEQLFSLLRSVIPGTLLNTWILPESPRSQEHINEIPFGASTMVMKPMSDSLRAHPDSDHGEHADGIVGPARWLRFLQRMGDEPTKAGYGVDIRRGGEWLCQGMAEYLTCQGNNAAKHTEEMINYFPHRIVSQTMCRFSQSPFPGVMLAADIIDYLDLQFPPIQYDVSDYPNPPIEPAGVTGRPKVKPTMAQVGQSLARPRAIQEAQERAVYDVENEGKWQYARVGLRHLCSIYEFRDEIIDFLEGKQDTLPETMDVIDREIIAHLIKNQDSKQRLIAFITNGLDHSTKAYLKHLWADTNGRSGGQESIKFNLETLDVDTSPTPRNLGYQADQYMIHGLTDLIESEPLSDEEILALQRARLALIQAYCPV